VRRVEIEELIERDPTLGVELVLELQSTVAALSNELAEVKRCLNQNSKNSSKPRSSDLPLTRQQRGALARSVLSVR
jgi:hypothetical protein